MIDRWFVVFFFSFWVSDVLACVYVCLHGFVRQNLVVIIMWLLIILFQHFCSMFTLLFFENKKILLKLFCLQAPTLYIFSYLLIVLGACMVVVSMFGCCGAITRSRVLLALYAVAVSILMLCTLAAGIYILYKRDGVNFLNKFSLLQYNKLFLKFTWDTETVAK